MLPLREPLPSNAAGTPALLTVEQAMSRIGGYGNRDAFVRSLRRAGLPPTKVKGRVFFGACELESWIDTRREGVARSRLCRPDTPLFRHLSDSHKNVAA